MNAVHLCPTRRKTVVQSSPVPYNRCGIVTHLTFRTRVMIEGLSHITFIVKDLDRMAAFLTGVFGAEEIYASRGREYSVSEEKFFMINGLWIAAMKGDPLPERTYNHVAFKIPDPEFEAYLGRIRSLGVEILEGRSRLEGEGRSVYFYDFDNHLFELHTGTLDRRMALYRHDSTG